MFVPAQQQQPVSQSHLNDDIARSLRNRSSASELSSQTQGASKPECAGLPRKVPRLFFLFLQMKNFPSFRGWPPILV